MLLKLTNIFINKIIEPASDVLFFDDQPMNVLTALKGFLQSDR
jgi:hypothetical protein